MFVAECVGSTSLPVFCGGQQRVCSFRNYCVRVSDGPRTTGLVSRSASLATGIFTSTSSNRFHVEFTMTCGHFNFVYVPVDFKYCASYGFAFCKLPEQSHSEDVSLSISGDAWLDVSSLQMTERASPGLGDTIERCVNSPVVHDAVPARYKPLLFHGRVISTTTKSIRFPTLRGFNLSHSKWRCQGQEQNAAWNVARGTPFL